MPARLFCITLLHYDKIFAVLFEVASAVLVHKFLLRAGRDVKVYRFANLVIHQHNGCVHAYFVTVYIYHVFHLYLPSGLQPLALSWLYYILFRYSCQEVLHTFF